MESVVLCLAIANLREPPGLGAYIVLEFVMLVVQIVRVISFFMVGLTASKELFQRMTHAILRAPLRWIDTVPSGRILNRFTSDTFVVDRRLSNQAFTFLRNILFLAVIIATRYVSSQRHRRYSAT